MWPPAFISRPFRYAIWCVTLKAAVKLGGFAFPLKLNFEGLRTFAGLLSRLSKRHRLVVVCGGGEGARSYISLARRFGASEAVCDQLGIYFSRLNAHLLIAALGEASFPRVPANLEEMQQYFSSGRMVVMGGLQPGHSTNAVAALAAETIGADVLINATDVDGVYTADPKTAPSARKLDEISTGDLSRLLSEGGFAAGYYDLMDTVAVKVIERSRMRTYIVDGRDPRNIELALKGRKIGTRLKHSKG